MNEKKWLWYVLTHGFEEMRYRKKGSLKTAVVIVVMFFFGNIVSDRLCGLQFSMPDDKTFSIIPYIMISLLFPAWAVSCSAVSTFLDGEGTLRNTAVYSAYALVPYVAQQYINTLLSHILIRDEMIFIQLIRLAGISWTAVLLFSAVRTVHQYTFAQTVVSVVMTVFFMLMMLFLLILFMSLIQQMWTFVLSVFTEIIYRLRG